MTRLLARLRAWLAARRNPHAPYFLSGPGVEDAAGGWWLSNRDDAPGDVPHIDPDHAAKISAANASRHVQTREGKRT